LLYQQLDYPLVLLIYSLHEGRVSILYRIGKDRIRAEKRRRKRGGKEEQKESQRNMGET